MLRGCMVRIIPIDELSANSGCSPDRLYPAPETLHCTHQFLSDPACVQSARQTNMEMECHLQEIIPHVPPRVCRRRPQGRLTAMHKVIGTLNAQRRRLHRALDPFHQCALQPASPSWSLPSSHLDS